MMSKQQQQVRRHEHHLHDEIRHSISQMHQHHHVVEEDPSSKHSRLGMSLTIVTTAKPTKKKHSKDYDSDDDDSVSTLGTEITSTNWSSSYEGSSSHRSPSSPRPAISHRVNNKREYHVGKATKAAVESSSPQLRRVPTPEEVQHRYQRFQQQQQQQQQPYDTPSITSSFQKPRRQHYHRHRRSVSTSGESSQLIADLWKSHSDLPLQKDPFQARRSASLRSLDTEAKKPTNFIKKCSQTSRQRSVPCLLMSFPEDLSEPVDVRTMSLTKQPSPRSVMETDPSESDRKTAAATNKKTSKKTPPTSSSKTADTEFKQHPPKRSLLASVVGATFRSSFWISKPKPKQPPPPPKKHSTQELKQQSPTTKQHAKKSKPKNEAPPPSPTTKDKSTSLIMMSDQSHTSHTSATTSTISNNNWQHKLKAIESSKELKVKGTRSHYDKASPGGLYQYNQSFYPTVAATAAEPTSTTTTPMMSPPNAPTTTTKSRLVQDYAQEW